MESFTNFPNESNADTDYQFEHEPDTDYQFVQNAAQFAAEIRYRSILNEIDRVSAFFAEQRAQARLSDEVEYHLQKAAVFVEQLLHGQLDGSQQMVAFRNMTVANAYAYCALERESEC
jgi:hypothetical protein